jgi:hypothetical protein
MLPRRRASVDVAIAEFRRYSVRSSAQCRKRTRQLQKTVIRQQDHNRIARGLTQPDEQHKDNESDA